MFDVLRLVYLVSLAATLWLAWSCGRRDVREGGIIVLIATVASMAVQASTSFDWYDGRAGLVIVDVAVLAAFVRLSLSSDRFWPLWASACQLIAVATHGVMALRSPSILQAYALAQGFWAYPIFVAILIGSLGRRDDRVR